MHLVFKIIIFFNNEKLRFNWWSFPFPENLRKYLQPEDVVEPLVKKRKSDDSDSKQKNIPTKCKLDLTDTIQCEGPGSSVDIYEFSE